MKAQPGGAVSGTFPSLKLGRSVGYSSSIERDFLFFVEFDAQAMSYTEQPLSICGTLPDGTAHQYTPDFLVHYRSSSELVECKPSLALDHPHTLQQCWLGETWAAAHGYRFRVVTDAELRTGAELANLKLLWRYGRLAVTPDHVNRCLQLIATHGLLTISQLASFLQVAGDEAALPLIYHLLFHHRLQTNLGQPLTGDSALSRRE